MAVRPVPSIPWVTWSAVEDHENPDDPFLPKSHIVFVGCFKKFPKLHIKEFRPYAAIIWKAVIYWVKLAQVGSTPSVQSVQCIEWSLFCQINIFYSFNKDHKRCSNVIGFYQSFQRIVYLSDILKKKMSIDLML